MIVALLDAVFFRGALVLVTETRRAEVFVWLAAAGDMVETALSKGSNKRDRHRTTKPLVGCGPIAKRVKPIRPIY